jgi:polyisoprenoid-binding protein YceI
MATKWKVDPAHSELFFKIKYLMISGITGSLNAFNLEVETEGADFGQVTQVHFSAGLLSLYTNNEQRDEHLRSPDFFDIGHHPELTFNGTSFVKEGLESRTNMAAYRKDYKLYGNLTVKGITKPVTLEGEFGGTAIDEYGQKRAGFSIRGKISRKEFGLNKTEMSAGTKVVLGDDVKISGNIQLVRQA